MSIEIEKEPSELWKEFKCYERCYFCKNTTDTWNMETNNPVCKDCADKHEVSELPNHFKR